MIFELYFFASVGKILNAKMANKLIIQLLAIFLVPGAGVEPARIAPLVFETSASTDSAIRASHIFKFREKVFVGFESAKI